MTAVDLCLSGTTIPNDIKMTSLDQRPCFLKIPFLSYYSSYDIYHWLLLTTCLQPMLFKGCMVLVHAWNNVTRELYDKPLTVGQLGDINFVLRASDFGDFAAFMAILARYLLCMLRSGCIWDSGENSDIAIWFIDPYFLTVCEISMIWQSF